jgi:hypothetical protein
MRRALTWLYGRPYLLLIFTMLMWGGNAVASRLAVGEVSPMAAWCTDHGCGRTDPYPVRGQARRTELGRPSSSM